MVEQAEDFIFGLGFRQVRVRHYGDTARIEVDEKEIEKILKLDVRKKITEHLKTVGYKFVTIDLEGYKTGKMNNTIQTADNRL